MMFKNKKLNAIILSVFVLVLFVGSNASATIGEKILNYKQSKIFSTTLKKIIIIGYKLKENTLGIQVLM